MSFPLRSWSAVIALPSAIAFASGCGSGGVPTAEATGSTASAIQGGTVDKTDNYAVGVCGTDQTPGTCSYVCSGVLIAPNLVATARHCVDEAMDLTVACSGDSFGGPLLPAADYWITTDYDMLQSTKGWHQTKQVVVPQETGFCGDDIALLILKDTVDPSEAAPVTPLVQYAITDPNLVSGSETAIGYGNTSATTNSYGTRHARQNIPILCIPGDATAPCAPVSQSNIASNEFAAGDGPCDGDSGSGSFEQNSYNQGMPLALGVLSRGGEQGSECSGSVYTRFDVYKDLLVQTVTTAAALGGYPLPAWTQPAPVGAEADDAGPAEGGTDAACPDEDCTTAQPSHHGGGCSTSPRQGDEPAGLAWIAAAGLVFACKRRRKTRKRHRESDGACGRSIDP